MHCTQHTHKKHKMRKERKTLGNNKLQTLNGVAGGGSIFATLL